MLFQGCGTAMVTPFRKDGSLDELTLRSLVKRQIQEGINFLVPCGTTGESPTLSHKEHLRVVEITLEEAKGRVPVLAGAGGYNTAEVIELGKEMKSMGADGILSVTPYYNKPTQEGLYQHYKAIASAVQLPIIVYSVQGRTGVNVEPATLKRLAEIDNIIGVKEASGNIGQMAAWFTWCRRTSRCSAATMPSRIPLIALGGKGVISVVSNEIPARVHQAGPARPCRRFRRCARAAAQVPPADGSQFRRIESDSGEGRHGDDGPAASRCGGCPCARRIAANLAKIEKVLEASGLLAAGACMRAEIEKLFDHKPAAYTEEHFRFSSDSNRR